MHEGSIAQAILDQALAQAPPEATKITRVSVAIGVLAGIEREGLTMFLGELARGSKAEGLTLEIRPIPAQLVCGRCGARVEFDGVRAIEVACRACGGPNRLEGGSGMYFESMEVETP